ncbi:LCP family protein [Herbiconiux sp. SYSU D00978]|uniref:LCP family protein n=1 Tax=Herbiconiux sp. SYSU D00978 TaxID=2812562 RepID=UPI001A9629F0|nr:LCP family protein [Herbiconiux sp. SYSU D00978]
MSDELRRRRDRGPRIKGIARHGRLPRRGPVGSLFRFVAAATAVLLVSIVSVGSIALWQLQSGIQVIALPGQEPGEEFNVADYEGGFNVLLVGSDIREGQSGSYGKSEGSNLNDVNILVHVSGDHTRATAVSIPRDLLVSIPACPKEDGSGNYPAMTSQQINSSLQYGGMPCTVLTVQALTGLEIQFAGLITFDGVIAMSNAIGGVDVCITEDLSDKHTELYLSAGTHSLQGADALKFLRTRYGVGDGGDQSRISSQQVFLSSMMRKIMAGGVLSNPAELYKLAYAATQNMSLTTSSADTLVSLAYALKDIPLENIQFVQYPAGASAADANRLVPNDEAADQLMQYLIDDVPFGITAGETGNGSTADPNAPATEQPTETGTESAAPEATPSAEPSSDPSASAAPSEPAVIDGLKGQTAADYTCTVPN